MRRALPRLPLQTRHPARCQDPKKVSSPLLPCPLKRFAPQPVRWFPLDRNSCALADRIRQTEVTSQAMARASTKQGLKTTVHVLTGDYPLKEGYPDEYPRSYAPLFSEISGI